MEAVLARLAKREHYVLPSPSREEVARQAAMEVQPLIMEPVSSFYAHPVGVFDFQSLYPSVVRRPLLQAAAYHTPSIHVDPNRTAHTAQSSTPVALVMLCNSCGTSILALYPAGDWFQHVFQYLCGPLESKHGE